MNFSFQFGVTVLVIVCLEILFIVLLYVFWEKIAAFLEKSLLKGVLHYQDDPDLEFVLNTMHELVRIW